MLRRFLVLLVAAATCGGSGCDDPPQESDGSASDPPHESSGQPDEWDPLVCSWQDLVDGGSGIGYANGVALASGGDVVVAGTFSPWTTWLRRYSATGEVVWTNDDSASVGEPPRSVVAMAVDHQDRLGLTGYIWDDEDGDFWVAEYEASGELAWSVDLDTGGHGEAACFSPAGDLYVTGGILDPEDDSSLYATLIWVGKFAADGTLLWQRTQPGLQPGQSRGDALVCDESGGVVVLGSRRADGYGEAWIRRYGPQGDTLWTTQVADPHGTSPEAMLPGTTAADELLVTVHIYDHTQLFRIDLADGAIRSESLAPDRIMLGADEGGIFVDGHFGVETDPDCPGDDPDPCQLEAHWGYAYYDWDAELVWWRADTSGIPNDEARNEMQSLATGPGARVLVGAVQDDFWVCHE